MGKGESRTRYMLINVLTGTVGEALQLILQFVCRTIFIYTLAEEYLGINGLFENILKILSLTELGFGSALIYSMYKPISEDNRSEICALMNLYKRIYNIIGLLIFSLGLLLTPFLNVLVRDGEKIPYLKLIFVLVLVNSVSTYFMGYKSSIINASQKKYITTMIQKIFQFVEVILKTVILLYFKEYIVYLLIGIFCNIGNNICQYIITDKMYPYLKSDRHNLPSKEIQHEIFKNTKAMALHKIGSVIVTGTDNLIISSFVNIASVGLYSNYMLILNSVGRFTSMISSTMTASVGNLVATCDMDKIYRTFRKVAFMNLWIHGFCACCFMTLLNPFIQLWLGERFVFPIYVVALIVFNKFLFGFREAPIVFRDAMGLFWYDRYKPLLEVIVNLIVSIVLVQVIGISGVFLGTICSAIFVCCWIEPYVLFKHGFHKPLYLYFLQVIPISITIVIITALMFYCEIFLPLNLVGFIGRMIMTCIGYNVLMFVVYRKCDEYTELKKLIITVISGGYHKIFKRKA